MKRFSELISAIEITNKTNAKIEALVQYFTVAEDKDKLWMITLFTGKRPPRPVKSTLLKQWCAEITQLPEWLFLESYTRLKTFLPRILGFFTTYIRLLYHVY